MELKTLKTVAFKHENEDSQVAAVRKIGTHPNRTEAIEILLSLLKNATLTRTKLAAADELVKKKAKLEDVVRELSKMSMENYTPNKEAAAQIILLTAQHDGPHLKDIPDAINHTQHVSNDGGSGNWPKARQRLIQIHAETISQAARFKGEHNQKALPIAQRLFEKATAQAYLRTSFSGKVEHITYAQDLKPEFFPAVSAASKAVRDTAGQQDKTMYKANLVKWLDKKLQQIAEITGHRKYEKSTYERKGAADKERYNLSGDGLSNVEREWRDREVNAIEHAAKTETNLQQTLLGLLLENGTHLPFAAEAVERNIPLGKLSTDELERLASLPYSNHEKIILHAIRNPANYATLAKAVAESCKNLPDWHLKIPAKYHETIEDMLSGKITPAPAAEKTAKRPPGRLSRLRRFNPFRRR